jgi:diguanylate cyclase (GGDEF)-like protein
MSLPAVLIVEDDVQQIHQLSHLLNDLAELHFALCGADALRMASAQAFDLVLLDAHLPDMDGLDVCVRLKCQEATADLPIVFLTARTDEAFQVDGFEHGAADFIAKPMVPAVARARVKTQLRLKELADQLRRSALEDPLTGADNRRAFDQQLAREIALSQRHHTPLALVLVDIDHFKAYNDVLGHPEGDVCLQQVYRVLRHCGHRPTDGVARIGGEEFAMLLPATTLEGAVHVAEQVLRALEAAALPHPGSPLGRVTASLGVSTLDTEHADAQALLVRADRALYRAKALGRAQVQTEPAPATAEPGPLTAPATAHAPARHPSPAGTGHRRDAPLLSQ